MPLNKYEIKKKLFLEQNGLCWICNQPMFPPRKRKNNLTYTNGFETTIDHLDEKNSTNGKKRRIKAAHAKCNSIRHHLPLQDEKIILHIEILKKKFSNPDFLKQFDWKEH